MSIAARLGYLQDVRNAYLVYEGNVTPKKTQVTEVGWLPEASLHCLVKSNGTQKPSFTEHHKDATF